MSANENKELISRYFADLSGKPKPAALVDEYVEEQPLKDHIFAAEAAFPQYVIEAVDMIAEGDQVAVKARLKGKQQGEFNGIPATGREVDLPFHITYKIKDRKIVDHWMLLDGLQLLQQLGVMPPQPA